MIHLTTLLAESKLKLNIPSDIKKIHKLFKKNGKQLYVVGGAVRDAILGKSPKDFDLTTDAKPEEVEKIAKQGGFKTVDVKGRQFGVVIVNGHEIATFRKDIGKGRRPDAVDFTDIKGDVKRRDLTINALFYDIGKGQIVDLVGGIEDLKKKKIRTVGNAEQRFDEDPLRRLRAVRFSGSVGGRMSKSTWAALKKNSDLSGVSAERIRDEFVKGITKAKNVPNYFKMLKTLGMFKQIFPGLNIMSLSKLTTNDYIIQIAYILRNNDPNKIKTKLSSLRYKNKEVGDIWLLLHMMRPAQVIKDLPMFKKLQSNSTLKTPQISQWAKIYSNNIKKLWNWKISTTSKDAIDKGMKGKGIGDYIKQAEEKKFLES
jgi:tRNA nucleotidyltransferase/poly(A) polymerase